MLVLLMIVACVWATPAIAAESSRAGDAPTLLALPEINGPGKVLRQGNVRMKVANWGMLGNPFTNLSSDPSGMWPDSSGIEYLHHISLAVAAKDPAPPPGVPAHRVSYAREWSPPTSDVEDRLYRTWQTAPNGRRYFNDDADGDGFGPRIDEDFLDGRDNDGDGQIDEDFGGLGYEGYSCVMRDAGPYTTPSGASPDTALGLEVRQTVWNYQVAGYEDFVAAEYRVINRSGHALDSVFVGFQVDFDAGPFSAPVYFMDDRDLPGYPRGEFTIALDAGDLQRQHPHSPAISGVSADSALCPRRPVRINGFSVVDGDGDAGQTPGVATFLLIDHTIDPLGAKAPARVGFRAFRSFPGGTPFEFGGNPITDAQRHQFMSGTENVDPATGFVNAPPGGADADYIAWCSVGPFRNLPDGGEVVVTVAFQVAAGNLAAGLGYAADLADYESGSMSYADLIAAHPLVGKALDVQLLRDGSHSLDTGGAPVPDFHGRETPLRLPLGAPPVFVYDCHEIVRIVTDQDYTWFDFDCDYCTGAWDHATQSGLLQRTWDMAPGLLAVSPGPGGATRGLRIVAAGPNPAAGSAMLTFELSRGGRGRVEILDAAGRRVRQIEERAFAAGRASVVWDGRDEAGLGVAPGVYLWRVVVEGEMAARKVAVVE